MVRAGHRPTRTGFGSYISGGVAPFKAVMACHDHAYFPAVQLSDSLRRVTNSAIRPMASSDSDSATG